MGGVEVAEMNGLELEFLFALRFRLNVTPDTFASYCAALEGEMMTDEPAPPSSPVVGGQFLQEEKNQDQTQKGATVASSAFTAAQRAVEITQ